MTTRIEPPRANKTDAGNGSKAIGRVIDSSRSPSPDPRRSAQKMKKRRIITTLLVTAGLLAWFAVREVPFGAFGIPYFVASVDEGHRVPGKPWRIIYNDAGAAHSGNFWTWVVEDRGFYRVVVAHGYSPPDVRYGDSPLPSKIEDGSIYLGFASSRYHGEIDWQRVDTSKRNEAEHPEGGKASPASS